MKRLVLLSVCVGMLLNSTAQGNEAIAMHFVDENGIGASAGQVFVSETKFGLVFTPALAGLPPGVHGFHVHEHASCLSLEKEGKKIPAAKAGGHYDPEKTAAHGFPWGEGHLGDLPPLYVTTAGQASQPVLAPRLKLGDLKGRSLIVHAGGDNHADHPSALGGGGARIVCGVNP